MLKTNLVYASRGFSVYESGHVDISAASCVQFGVACTERYVYTHGGVGDQPGSC